MTKNKDHENDPIYGMLETDEQREMYAKLSKLHSETASIEARLVQLNVSSDTADGRIVHLMYSLVKTGILTVDQFLSICEEWETKVHATMSAAWKNVEARLQQIETQQRLGLLGKGSNSKLIVPPGNRPH